MHAPSGRGPITLPSSKVICRICSRHSPAYVIIKKKTIKATMLTIELIMLNLVLNLSPFQSTGLWRSVSPSFLKTKTIFGSKIAATSIVPPKLLPFSSIALMRKPRRINNFTVFASSYWFCAWLFYKTASTGWTHWLWIVYLKPSVKAILTKLTCPTKWRPNSSS